MQQKYEFSVREEQKQFFKLFASKRVNQLKGKKKTRPASQNKSPSIMTKHRSTRIHPYSQILVLLTSRLGQQVY